MSAGKPPKFPSYADVYNELKKEEGLHKGLHQKTLRHLVGRRDKWREDYKAWLTMKIQTEIGNYPSGRSKLAVFIREVLDAL